MCATNLAELEQTNNYRGRLLEGVKNRKSTCAVSKRDYFLDMSTNTQIISRFIGYNCANIASRKDIYTTFPLPPKTVVFFIE